MKGFPLNLSCLLGDLRHPLLLPNDLLPALAEKLAPDYGAIANAHQEALDIAVEAIASPTNVNRESPRTNWLNVLDRSSRSQL